MPMWAATSRQRVVHNLLPQGAPPAEPETAMLVWPTTSRPRLVPVLLPEVGPLPPVVSLQERNDRLAAAKEQFPSTQMDMVDWMVAFLDDNALFNRILDDMASITGRQIRRGALQLDHRGREIGSSASVAVQGGTET
jgi:hypothetical protein